MRGNSKRSWPGTTAVQQYSIHCRTLPLVYYVLSVSPATVHTHTLYQGLIDYYNTVLVTQHFTYQAVWAANIVDDHYPTTVITNIVGCLVRVCAAQSPLKPGWLCQIMLPIHSKTIGGSFTLLLCTCTTSSVSLRREYSRYGYCQFCPLFRVATNRGWLLLHHSGRVHTQFLHVRAYMDTSTHALCVAYITLDTAHRSFHLRTAHSLLCMHYLWLQFKGGFYSSTWNTVQSQNSWLGPCTSLKS